MLFGGGHGLGIIIHFLDSGGRNEGVGNWVGNASEWESFVLLVSRTDLGPTVFARNARGTFKERRWARLIEPDLRDTGCCSRKKYHLKSKYEADLKEMQYQVNGYWQRSGLGHIGRWTRWRLWGRKTLVRRPRYLFPTVKGVARPRHWSHERIHWTY